LIAFSLRRISIFLQTHKEPENMNNNVNIGLELCDQGFILCFNRFKSNVYLYLLCSVNMILC